MKIILKFFSGKNVYLPFIILICSYIFSASAENSGVVAFNAGNYKEAEEYFLVKLKENDFKNESLVYLSKIYLKKGDTQNAVQYIEQALAIAPTDVEELLLSADIYCNHAQKSSIFTALKMAKKCIAQYDTAVSMEPENIKALVASIKFYMMAPSIAGGSTQKGNELLERLSHLSPEDADVCRITFLEKEGKSNDALMLAGTLNKNGFKSVENQYAVAHYYKEKKNYDKSKLIFEALLASKETQKNKWFYDDSLLQLGEVFLAEGVDPNQGIKLIEAYKKKNNDPYDVHYFWSTWSLAKGYKLIGENDKYKELVKNIKSENYKRDSFFSKEFDAST